MRLNEALRLKPGEIVAFVGGGGKSTAMFRLAAEIVGDGGRVLTTTTTRIFAAQTRLAPNHFALDANGAPPADLDRALAANPHLLLTGPASLEDGKATGVPLSLLSELFALHPGLNVLIEADGSRMRPLKAPAEREPVIPVETTLVVPVAGADVLGRPLDETHVHRADLVGRLTGLAPGAPLSAEAVACLLAHSSGGRKAAPPGARVVPLINKVDGPGRLEGARLVARLLLDDSIDSVVLGAVASAEPAVEAWSRIAAVVLAAGSSSRMGSVKQLLPWGASTLVEQAVDAALASLVSEVIVVTGCQSADVAAAIGARPVRIVENRNWAEGQSTSVQSGLAAIRPGGGGAVFVLADQPFVTSAVIDALIRRHRETLAPIVAPRSGGRRGNPVLFDAAAWPTLAAVTGDTGGRGLFEAYAGRIGWVEWDESIMADVDTPEDYRALSVPATR